MVVFETMYSDIYTSNIDSNVLIIMLDGMYNEKIYNYKSIFNLLKKNYNIFTSDFDYYRYKTIK